MSRRLGRPDYAWPATELAPALLGKLLCRRLGGEVIRARITETECYYGEQDSACHAHRGRTKRTATLYEPGGTAYVYLCYGIHEMLNVVSGPEGHPEAVLLRGVEGADGPGRLTKRLGVDRALNGIDLAVSEELWIEDDGAVPEREASERVGIGYAEPDDRARLWRWRVIGDAAKK